jgi:hypothetical protein
MLRSHRYECRLQVPYVKRILRSAIFVLATVYFIVDAIFLKVAAPIARWLARKKIFIRFRKWIGSLRPYPSLALFAVPVILLEPVKPVAAYLMATGSVSAGMTVLITGELLKLVIIERLFKLCRLFCATGRLARRVQPIAATHLRTFRPASDRAKSFSAFHWPALDGTEPAWLSKDGSVRRFLSLSGDSQTM